MQWNDDKDVLLMREVLGKSMLILKPGSQERGQAWQRVADELNALDGFHLTGRAVRDRIMTLIKKFKVKINKDKNQTGEGGGEPSEFEVLVEEVINISEDTLQKKETEKEKAKEKETNEQNKALEIRQVAMETMGQTRKRNSGEEDAHNRQKRSRRSNSEIMEFLRQKIELDKENLEADREEKRNQNAILMNLINQQQQMMAQQTAIFRELLNNKNN